MKETERTRAAISQRRDQAAQTQGSLRAERLPIDVGVIRELMWRDVGLFREGHPLLRAVATLEETWTAVEQQLHSGRDLDADAWRAVNLATVARLIARAAERRQESRGAHYREDHPQRDDIHWKRRVTETRE
jgi:succinate dehydrogenase/fumarate reductase flavoprotein subunit